MLPVKAWKIIYADGSTFSSADGTWAEAPPFGVQTVVYYHVPDGVTLHVEPHDESVYYWMGESELDGVKVGLWMDSEGYYRIIDAAGKGSP